MIQTEAYAGYRLQHSDYRYARKHGRQQYLLPLKRWNCDGPQSFSHKQVSTGDFRLISIAKDCVVA